MREGQQWRARLGSGQYTSRRASISSLHPTMSGPALESALTRARARHPGASPVGPRSGTRAPRGTRVAPAVSVRPSGLHAAALCCERARVLVHTRE